MAVLQVEEPGVDTVSIDDWHKLVNRTTVQGGGFMLLSLSEMETTARPRVLQGSRFELNGALYIVENDEDIQDPSGGLGEKEYFIYAVPTSEGVIFQFFEQRPSFNPMLGGWFSGQSRCIGRTTYFGPGWYNKVVMDSYDAINSFNPANITEVTGTTIWNDTTFNKWISKTLLPGVYRVTVAGGKGGNGGNGGYNTNTPYIGGQGGQGGQITVIIYLIITQPALVRYIIGKDGTKGGDGNLISGNIVGGGGGASGMPSLFYFNGELVSIASGGGGGGGGSSSRYFNGSSGGGGDGGGGASGGAPKSTPGDGNPGSNANGSGNISQDLNNIMSGYIEDGTAGNSGSIGTEGGIGGTGTQNATSGYVQINRVFSAGGIL
jgi:hypothetical protein